MNKVLLLNRAYFYCAVSYTSEEYMLFKISLLSLVSEFRIRAITLNNNLINTEMAESILVTPLIQSSLEEIFIHDYDITQLLTILSLVTKCRMIKYIQVNPNKKDGATWSDEDQERVTKALQNIELGLRNIRQLRYHLNFYDVLFK